jgi:hypothetical protein
LARKRVHLVLSILQHCVEESGARTGAVLCAELVGQRYPEYDPVCFQSYFPSEAFAK